MPAVLVTITWCQRDIFSQSQVLDNCLCVVCLLRAPWHVVIMPTEGLLPKPSSPDYQNPLGNIRSENRWTQLSYSGHKTRETEKDMKEKVKPHRSINGDRKRTSTKKRESLKMRKSARDLWTLSSPPTSFTSFDEAANISWWDAQVEETMSLCHNPTEKSLAKSFSFPSLHVKSILKLEAISLL